MTVEEQLKTDPVAHPFSLAGTPELAGGRYDQVLARGEDLAARVKVYFEGGENATHTHLEEEHLFFVLGGEATFHLGRDGEETVVAGTHDGVLLPRGSFYRFASSGTENLVMLRVATHSSGGDRTGPDNLPLPGHSEANHHVDAVPVPDAFFKAPRANSA